VSSTFIAVLRIELFFPDVASLKGKRAELAPVKVRLDKMGASVAEVEHQDLWQRATLAAAFAGGSPGRLDAHLDTVSDWLDARFPQGVRTERVLASWDDLVGIA
jgi:uncharacterized protein YlxP (DUF503 family)